MVSAVAIWVLDGTQSVSTQAPPRPSASTTVTRAPSCAATKAASYPPGPPPRIATSACDWLTRPHSLASRRPPAAAPAYVRGYMPGIGAVWLAGGTVTCTGWLIAEMFTVVVTFWPLTDSVSIIFRT